MSRPKLELKLGDKPIAHEAKSIVDAWILLKKMSEHLPKAICLYQMLVAGEYDKFMDALISWQPDAYRYFNRRTGVIEQPVSRMAITETPKPIAKAVVKVEELSSAQIANNMASSLGIDDF